VHIVRSRRRVRKMGFTSTRRFAHRLTRAGRHFGCGGPTPMPLSVGDRIHSMLPRPFRQLGVVRHAVNAVIFDGSFYERW